MFIHDAPSMQPIYRSKLELDLDPLAERFAILDRSNLNTIHTAKVGNNTFYLNKKFNNGNNLMLVILDDNREYNAAILDGINGQSFDVSTI
jgi:hypothetical protein